MSGDRKRLLASSKFSRSTRETYSGSKLMETCRLIAELVSANGRELQQCQTAAKAIELARKEQFDLEIGRAHV